MSLRSICNFAYLLNSFSATHSATVVGEDANNGRKKIFGFAERSKNKG